LLIKLIGVVIGVIIHPIGYIIGFLMRPFMAGWVAGYTHIGNLETKALNDEFDKRQREKAEADEILRFAEQSADGSYGRQSLGGLHQDVENDI
jgi:hypothetical protein